MQCFLKVLFAAVIVGTVACGNYETDPADAGSTDSGTTGDGGTDAGTPDSGAADSGTPDSGTPPVCSDQVANCGGQCSTRCGVGKHCNGTPDCESGLTCESNQCITPIVTVTLEISSNVSSNPNAHLYYNGSENPTVRQTTFSLQLTSAQICNSFFSVSGSQIRAVKLAAELNGLWWDCNTAEKKQDNLIFKVNGNVIPREQLIMYNSGSACGGQGAGDLFIPASALGFSCG